MGYRTYTYFNMEFVRAMIRTNFYMRMKLAT